MNSFLKGLLLGAATVAAALMGYAYGRDDHPNQGVRGALAQCNVEIGLGLPDFGEECLFDKVMIGVRDDYILCADLTVTCP